MTVKTCQLDSDDKIKKLNVSLFVAINLLK